MMDRRKQLMAGGGIAVAAILGVGAIAGSVGVFGLSDDPPRVGKLSPIDSTRTTTVTAPDSDDDTPLGTTPDSTPGATVGTTPNTAPGADDDTPGATVGTTPNTAPGVDDHGGDRVGGDDNSGPGSSNSGPGSSNSGPGSSGSGRDHPEDD